jgi:hypothetical protein
MIANSLSHLHPLADADTLSGKLAKASLRGEGWGDGVFELCERSSQGIRYHFEPVPAGAGR